MRRRFGTTVVLTTHDLKDISTTCERLLVLDQGHLLYDGDCRVFSASSRASAACWWTCNGGLPSERLFPYLIAAFVLNFTLSLSVEVRFGQRLRQGLITSDLLRPLGFMPFQLAQAVGDAAANLVLALPLLALAAFELGGALLPADLLSGLAGVVSVGLGFLVNFGVSYLVVQASFVTSSFYGIFFTRMALHQVFSGLSAPLVLFPPALQAVAVWMPFRHVIETPALVWLGHAALEDVPLLLLEQAGWACGTIALSVGLFRAALGRHQVQGG
jgi:ABC-2 type transport system permease protein